MPIEGRGTGKPDATKSSEPARLLFAAAGCGLFGLVFLAAAVRLSLENQVMLGLGALALLYAAGWARSRRPEWSRIAVILLGAFISLRYWMFRTTETLGFQDTWSFGFLVLLYLAETYGILIHFMGMFVNISPLTRRIPPLPDDPDRLPTVDVFIPTYDEDVELVDVTATACTQLDYPPDKLNIYVLDDGGTDQKLNDPDPRRSAAAARRVARLKAMASQLGVNYLARAANHNAKAGNINDGLLHCGCGQADGERSKAVCVNSGFTRSRGDLVLILDCDHVPTRDLLRNTVGFFLQDANLFLVQTPHFFINPTPVETNLETHRRSPKENEMFYGAVQLGLDFWNSSFFCGSAAILRRKPLVDIGGIAGETVTEDAETALTLHSKGWNSVYLNKPMVMGLSPESFDDFILQRSRWAQGMTQILLLKNPLRRKGLKWSQRICYFNSCLFWLFGFARIVYFISPLMFLFFGLRVYNASGSQILLYALPHVLASYYVANYLYGKLRHPFFSELFETIQSIFLAPVILSVFRNPRRPKFQVTPKTIARRQDGLTPLFAPFYAMFLLAGAGYVASVLRWIADPQLWDTVLACTAWNTFNLLLTLCCLGVVWERRQRRHSHRYETHEPISVRMPGASACMPATLVDLSTTGFKLETDTVFDIPGGRLVLEAHDSDRRTHSLSARVIRAERKPGGMSIGCEFDSGSAAARQQVIGFVYGDSSRLKYFHQANLDRHISFIRGFLNLLSIGANGSIRSMAGLLKIILDLGAGLAVKIISSPQTSQKGEAPDESLKTAAHHHSVPDLLHGHRHSGEHTNSLEKTGAGSGPPAARDDGQLHLHHPRPRTLEGDHGDSAF